MTQAIDFRMVDEQVARNPIARAIARQRMASGTRDFMLRLYLLPDGADVTADAQTAAKVLTVAVAVLDADSKGNSPDARVMAGGISALAGLSQNGWRWRSADAVAVDQALQRAMQVYRTAGAAQLQAAYVRLAQLEFLAGALER